MAKRAPTESNRPAARITLELFDDRTLALDGVRIDVDPELAQAAATMRQRAAQRREADDADE